MRKQVAQFLVEALEGRTLLSGNANIVGTFTGHGYSSVTGDEGNLTFVIKTESAPDKRGVSHITGTENDVFGGASHPYTLAGTIKGTTFSITFTGKYDGTFSGSVTKAGKELTGTYTDNVPDHGTFHVSD
jgi:hypothetical protein